MTNAMLVARAQVVMMTYQQWHEQDEKETLLVDLLADLKHWAVANIPDVDLWAVDERARNHFNAECQEARFEEDVEVEHE